MPAVKWIGASALWYEQLEDLMLWSLRADFSLERFDLALQRIDTPSSDAVTLVCGDKVNDSRVRLLQGKTHVGAVLSALPPPVHGSSLWWCDGSDHVRPCLLQCGGLPVASQFAAMLDGQWGTRGWQL
jgi:type VI secretion system protein ImpM